MSASTFTKHYRVAYLRHENVTFSEPGMCFTTVRWITPFGARQKQVYCSRKFDAVDESKRAIMLNLRVLPRTSYTLYCDIE